MPKTVDHGASPPLTSRFHKAGTSRWRLQERSQSGQRRVAQAGEAFEIVLRVLFGPVHRLVEVG